MLLNQRSAALSVRILRWFKRYFLVWDETKICDSNVYVEGKYGGLVNKQLGF